VIPGAERSDAQRNQALTDRQRLEMEARQQQSKMRRLDGNSGDAGPLFNDQPDMFAAPAAAAPVAPTFPTTLEALAPKGRLSHIYGEYQGERFYLDSLAGNPDRRMNDLSKVLPGVRILSTDRADGTSINGDRKALDAKLAAAKEATPAADAQTESLVGESWAVWPNGAAEPTTKRVISTEMRNGAPVFLVQTDGERTADILTAEQVAQERTRDTRNLESRKARKDADRQKEVAEKKRKDEAEDVDGFTDNMTPLQAGKVLGALTAKVNYNGRAVSRRDLIREKVNNGAVIEELDAEGEILMSPDETFLNRKAITKIGLDYAKHLIAARDSQDTNQPAPSPTDPKAEAALKWLRDKAVHVPAQDETITVTDAMAEEDGIAPGEYRVRMFTFRGEIPSHMKTALRGVGDNHDFARSEFIRFGNQRSNQNTIEYTRMERDAVTPTSTPSQRTKGEPAAKIEDFGEKLEGARKDTWAGYADRMKNAEDVDIHAEPLSKSWPAPDYEKLIAEGIDPWTVAFIRVARDSIPTKPQKSWRLKGWAADVATLRNFAGKLIDGTYTKEDILRSKSGAFRERETIELYLAVGHGKSLKGLHLGAARYVVLNGVRHDPELVRWEVTAKGKATPFGNMPRVLAHGATKAEAIEAFKKVYDTLDAAPAKAKKGPKLIIYSRDGRKTWHVGVKIGSNHIDLRSADTVAEARRMIAEEADAIIEQLNRMRDTPRERRDENQPRVGGDHRSGG
ncbi:MAG: hypothetical protein KDJ82_15905, partial [Rhodobacteraceae bacterium]|nr:hypothetical protein [Paracoccaceae bacterium]